MEQDCKIVHLQLDNYCLAAQSNLQICRQVFTGPQIKDRYIPAIFRCVITVTTVDHESVISECRKSIYFTIITLMINIYHQFCQVHVQLSISDYAQLYEFLN